jgi:hypothetical protein
VISKLRREHQCTKAHSDREEDTRSKILSYTYPATLDGGAGQRDGRGDGGRDFRQDQGEVFGFEVN